MSARACPRPWLLSSVLVSGALLLGAFVRADDPTDAFRQGLTAVEKGNWPEVERRMRQAIAAKPSEGGSVKIYGMRFEEYLPHYYLGLALSQLGRCEEAIAEWQTSEGQGAVKKTGQYRTLTKGREACRAKLASAGPKPPAVTPTPASAPPATPTPPPGPDPTAVAAAVRRAEADVARADDSSRAAQALSTNPTLAKTWNADARLGPAHKRAGDLLASARSLLETGRSRPDLGALERAASSARDAEQQFHAIAQTATQVASARALEVRPAATPTPAAAPGPPSELVAAAQAYFAGRYREAATLLASPTFPQPKAQTQALLVRAAARFALYAVDGERDSTLLRAAQEDIRGARRLDPNLSPDARAFSPRFRDLVARSR